MMTLSVRLTTGIAVAALVGAATAAQVQSQERPLLSDQVFNRAERRANRSMPSAAMGKA